MIPEKSCQNCGEIGQKYTQEVLESQAIASEDETPYSQA
jgi:hypothetical protein